MYAASITGVYLSKFLDTSSIIKVIRGRVWFGCGVALFQSEDGEEFIDEKDLKAAESYAKERQARRSGAAAVRTSLERLGQQIRSGSGSSADGDTGRDRGTGSCSQDVQPGREREIGRHKEINTFLFQTISSSRRRV